jgi:hypothetical protein
MSAYDDVAVKVRLEVPISKYISAKCNQLLGRGTRTKSSKEPMPKLCIKCSDLVREWPISKDIYFVPLQVNTRCKLCIYLFSTVHDASKEAEPGSTKVKLSLYGKKLHLRGSIGGEISDQLQEPWDFLRVELLNGYRLYFFRTDILKIGSRHSAPMLGK